MDLTNILVIAGKPDLSEMVSQTKGGAIVKNLINGQKFPVFRNDRISSLGEIRIFTNSDEVSLQSVMQGLYRHLDAKPTDFDPRNTESAKMFALLEAVLPDYDRVRVHASDVKKILLWYNVLLAAEKIDLESDDATPQEQ